MRNHTVQFLCEFTIFLLGVYGISLFEGLQLWVSSVDTKRFSLGCTLAAFIVVYILGKVV